jgi:hypothetical protein
LAEVNRRRRTPLDDHAPRGTTTAARERVHDPGRRAA